MSCCKLLTTLTIVALCTALTIVTMPYAAKYVRLFLSWCRLQGAWAVVAVSSAVVIWAGLPMPGFIFLVTGSGAIFGALYGFLIVYVASLAGVAIVFNMVRCGCGCVRPCISAWMESERWDGIIEEAAVNGFRVSLLVKLLPFTGGGTTNIIFAAVTSIHFCQFFAACCIAHLKFLAYTSVGAAGAMLAQRRSENAVHRRNRTIITVSVGIVAVVAVAFLSAFSMTTLQRIERRVKARGRGERGQEKEKAPLLSGAEEEAEADEEEGFSAEYEARMADVEREFAAAAAAAAQDVFRDIIGEEEEEEDSNAYSAGSGSDEERRVIV